jgi:hypothetical protein
MRQKVLLLVIFLTHGLMASDWGDAPQAPQQLFFEVTSFAPANKDILFFNLLFIHLKPECRHHSGKLKRYLKWLTKKEPVTLSADFGTDTRYYHWFKEALEDLLAFNDSLESDLTDLALEYLGESVAMKDRLRFTNERKLLFLIRYISSLPPSQTVEVNRQAVRADQLLAVLMAEQNHRSGKGS